MNAQVSDNSFAFLKKIPKLSSFKKKIGIKSFSIRR